MLTALSMGGASRAAAGNGSECTEQRGIAPQASESWERRDIQETETKTVRNQHPASTAHAQRDWTGCNPASRHTHRPDHKRSDLAGMYPDPLPRHAHEPSVWAQTKQETNTRTRRHVSKNNERWSTRTRPRAKTRTRCDDYSGCTRYEHEYHRRRGAGSGAWTMVDINDVCNGAEYIAKEGPADGKRLAWSHRWDPIPLPCDNTNHRRSHCAI